MKVSLYTEQDKFNEFLLWVNRLSQGVLSTCPIQYLYKPDGLSNPIQIQLDGDEYAMLQDTERDLADLQKKIGNDDLIFTPTPYDNDMLLIQGILQNATRWDLMAEVVLTAVMIGQEIKDINPLEALIIAEREILTEDDGLAEKQDDDSDI